MSKKVKVLVVDDDTFNVRLMAEMCQSSGFEVCEAGDGARALELARTEMPELVLLDAMMAGKSGFDVCRELRADPLTASMAIIIVTALDDLESKMRGIEAGADDYVTKPFRLFELQQRISTVLQTRQYRNQLEDARRKLQRLGEFDTPGRIGGFRALKNGLEYEFRRAQRYEHPLSVLLLTLDDYDLLLEKQGHKAAAALVGALVVSLRETLRAVDRIYRLDKDRFLLLMPETPLSGSRIAAQRIRDRLQEPSLQQTNPVAVHACLLTFPHPQIKSVHDILHLLSKASCAPFQPEQWLQVID